MSVSRNEILDRLRAIPAPGGGDLVSRDLVRALEIEHDSVRFVIEAADADAARALEPARASAEAAVAAMEGVSRVTVVLTAPAAKPSAPPNLKIGRHATPEPMDPSKAGQIDRILAIGSGKGGVGKSTVSSNLAVALAKEGRKVGLLDADVYGPSQPRMMGINKRPASPDGKTIMPLHSHGVTMMSIGFMLAEDKAVVWRGPMLMGALQQMLTQVEWGKLDVLLVDLPPGTGDVALTLCQKSDVTGAIVVSTPQDVALLDARKAIDMFQTLKTPILGLIENMSSYVCPKCGHEEHIFGHGGVKDEAARLGVPLLGQIPLSLDIRLAGDAGTPIALGDTPAAQSYTHLARRLVGGGMA
ncbi:MAG: Mrp/NBP35 family ATP-binding protein [Pseudomonadota bacterium]